MKKLYKEKKSVIDQTELVPGFFIDILNLGVFNEKRFHQMVEASARMFTRSKSKNMFYFFSRSF